MTRSERTYRSIPHRRLTTECRMHRSASPHHKFRKIMSRNYRGYTAWRDWFVVWSTWRAAHWCPNASHYELTWELSLPLPIDSGDIRRTNLDITGDGRCSIVIKSDGVPEKVWWHAIYSQAVNLAGQCARKGKRGTCSKLQDFAHLSMELTEGPVSSNDVSTSWEGWDAIRKNTAEWSLSRWRIWTKTMYRCRLMLFIVKLQSKITFVIVDKTFEFKKTFSFVTKTFLRTRNSPMFVRLEILSRISYSLIEVAISRWKILWI